MANEDENTTSSMTNSANDTRMKEAEKEETRPTTSSDQIVKIYASRLPSSMSESQVTELFAEFGPVTGVTLIRSKMLNKPTQSCSVELAGGRESAMRAIKALHNVRTLPAMSGPMQVSLGDSATRNDRKLFVGMIDREMSETELEAMFGAYGEIEECLVLKDANGASRGCAFITYSSEAAADKAIACHEKIRAEAIAAGQRALNVKKADKERKAPQLPPPPSKKEQRSMSLNDSDLSAFSVERLALELQQRLALNKLIPSVASSSCSSSSCSSADSSVQFKRRTDMPRYKMRSWDQNSSTHGSNSGSVELDWKLKPSYMLNNNNNNNRSTNSTPQSKQAAAAPPPPSVSSCTLFINDFPIWFKEMDLINWFARYGAILSAKVFVDKQSELSTGSGFVCFAIAESAERAIRDMNGVMLEGKKLTVQLKQTDRQLSTDDL